jgi:hypothetical protein
MRSKLYCVAGVTVDGPTGEFFEVTQLAVQDYGGNELWRGEPGREPRYRIPVRLVAAKTGAPCDHGDILCDY